MKITIIGANGFIGRNLLYYLQSKRNDISLTSYDLADTQRDGAAPYRKIDMLDKSEVFDMDLDCDLIFMMAGKTGSLNGFTDYDSFIDVNQKALLNLLSAYVKQGSKAKIIFPSTRLVYKGEKRLLKESDEKAFNTVYAINKYACEQYLEQYRRVYGVKYTIFRICVPYGSYIPNASSYGTAEFMIMKAKNGENITLYGDGSVRRTLTHIEDLCTALTEGAISDACENDIFNVGGEDYSLKEMASLIAEQYGVGVECVPWPKQAQIIESGDTVFDDTKLRAAIGVRPIHKFSDWCDSKS